MELNGEARLLRIFFGEADKVGHRPLHEVIVQEARAHGLAGATVWRGILGYGPTSKIRSAKILDLSSDLPVIIEIVDSEEKIAKFLPLLDPMVKEGLVTLEKANILLYRAG